MAVLVTFPRPGGLHGFVEIWHDFQHHPSSELDEWKNVFYTLTELKQADLGQVALPQLPSGAIAIHPCWAARLFCVIFGVLHPHRQTMR